MENQSDSGLVKLIADDLIPIFNIRSWSFDKGYWHKDNKTSTVIAMDDLSEFKKMLRQIMSREPKPLMSEEDIKQSILEMEVLQRMGERIFLH